MSRIFFIRHGQASFLKTDYDQLSPLGIEQASLLGNHWAQEGISATKVYSGQLKRQKQTATHFMKGASLELSLLEHAGFDEHHGPDIVRHLYPEKFEQKEEIPIEEFDNYRRAFYGTYFKLANSWINGELDDALPQSHESWPKFRSRFKAALNHVLENCGSGENLCVFTSGGPVAAAVGEALNLSDEKTLELGWQVKNSSVTEFLYSRGRFSMVSFNELPHIRSRDYVTLV